MSEWRDILDNPPDYGVRFLGARMSRYGEWEAEVVAWEAKGLMTSAGVRFAATHWCPLPAPPTPAEPAPMDREALVRLLQIITRNGSLDDGRTLHEVIADALLARGLRLPDVVCHGTASHDTQAPLPVTGDTQAGTDTTAVAPRGARPRGAADVCRLRGLGGQDSRRDRCGDMLDPDRRMTREAGA